ncbi:MAG: type IV toxin-antitoxin system AbiEi family antitoxin domain-containing protein [Actinomycetota bacterium]
MSLHAEIARLAARQHTLVTRRQLLDAGFSTEQIRWCVRSGVLVRIRYDVFAVAGAPPTWEQAVLAAVLAVGPGAVASHATAAALWGLPGFERDAGLELTTARPHHARLAGVCSHRTVAFLALEHAVHHRIPCTSVARTLADVSGRMSVPALGAATDHGTRQGLLRLDDLRRCVAGLPPAPGRRPKRVQIVLVRRLAGYDPGESELEMRVMRAIVEAGLPEPVPQYWVRLGSRRCRIDLAYPELKLAIEVDGWVAHGTRTAFDRDRARQNDLVAAGWRPIRFTSSWTNAEIAATVSEHLAALSRDRAS